MPEILVLPSPATRRTYPLHLRIVCALVARLADLQVSMQHAHTARLVRNFPARYSPVERVERMQVQRTGDQIKVVDILACTRSHPHENMNEHCQALTTEARIRSESLAAAQENRRAALAMNPGNHPEFMKVTELEQDFQRMRAEVAQLLEDALSKSPKDNLN